MYFYSAKLGSCSGNPGWGYQECLSSPGYRRSVAEQLRGPRGRGPATRFFEKKKKGFFFDFVTICHFQWTGQLKQPFSLLFLFSTRSAGCRISLKRQQEAEYSGTCSKRSREPRPEARRRRNRRSCCEMFSGPRLSPAVTWARFCPG